jgi:hypothetical protein
LAKLGRAQVLHLPGADAPANAGDRNYLVLAKPGDAAGQKSPHNYAQTVRTDTLF